MKTSEKFDSDLMNVLTTMNAEKDFADIRQQIVQECEKSCYISDYSDIEFVDEYSTIHNVRFSYAQKTGDETGITTLISESELL